MYKLVLRLPLQVIVSPIPFFGIFSCIRCFILTINAQSSGVGVILWWGIDCFTYISQDKHGVGKIDWFSVNNGLSPIRRQAIV